MRGVTTTLGRIDPPKTEDPSLADPEAPPSPRVLRELHRDLLAQKRRAFLTGSPLLLLALFAWMVAIMDPVRWGGLVLFAVTAVAGVGRIGYEWLTLRDADPLTLYAREQRADEERHQQQTEFLLRSGAVRPVVTISIVSCVVAVTIVQFASGPIADSVTAAGLVKAAVRAGQWWRLLTASYLHGSWFHIVANATALMTLGRIIEIYDRRLRIPLVYAASAVGGSVLSTMLFPTSSIGASGGVLGLAGYVFVVAGRDPNGTPAWLRKQMVSILASTAVLGIAAFMFIDNAAHLGGALSGAALGYAVCRWGAHRQREFDAAGLAATVVLAAGAVFTVTRLLFA